MDLDSIYQSRAEPSRRFGTGESSRRRYGTGTSWAATPSYHRDPVPTFSAYSAAGNTRDGERGPYANPYRSYLADGARERRSSAARPPPPPPPPEIESPSEHKEQSDRKKSHRRKRRSSSSSDTGSDGASATVSTSTSEEETTSTTSTSSESSGYSFTSASASASPDSSGSSSTRDASTDSSKRDRPTAHRNSRARDRHTASAADIESAAAAAAEAILRKESALKRKELELLEEKQSFARDVRQRVSASRGYATEDEALARMQRLVALEDPTPSLHEYLRRTSGVDGAARTTPLLMDRSTAESQRSQQQQPEAVVKGMNRVSSYQPSSLQAGKLAVGPTSTEVDTLSAPGSSCTPTLVIHGAQPPSPQPQPQSSSGPAAGTEPAAHVESAKPTPLASSGKQTPSASLADTPPPPSRVRPDATASQGGSNEGSRSGTHEVELHPAAAADSAGTTAGTAAVVGDDTAASASQRAKSGSAAQPQSGGTAVDSPVPATATQTDGQVVTIDLARRKRRSRRKSVSRTTAQDDDGDAVKGGRLSSGAAHKAKATVTTPVRRRLNVRVRQQSRAHSRSVATETDMPHIGSPPAPQRQLLSPEAPQSRYVSPPLDSHPRNGSPPELSTQRLQQQLIPVEQQHLQSPSAAQQQQQPWAMAAINWPLRAPPQPATPSAASYTAATSGPMTNKEFKNLLCSEYVPPIGVEPQQLQQPWPDGGAVPGPERQHGSGVDAQQPSRSGAEASSWEDVDSPRNVLRTAERRAERRDHFEPFGVAAGDTQRPTRRQMQTGGQRVDGSALPEREEGLASPGDVDLADADLHNPSSAPPPPPVEQQQQQQQGGEAWARLADEESVVEFPPPPQFTAPDMPGPRPDDESDGEPDCCKCCSCLWHCLFPCCWPPGEEREERRRSANPYESSQPQQGGASAANVNAGAAAHTQPQQTFQGGGDASWQAVPIANDAAVGNQLPHQQAGFAQPPPAPPPQ